MNRFEAELGAVEPSGIDYLFTLNPYESGKSFNISDARLSEVAAAINAFTFFVVGPESDEMTQLESMELDRHMRGQSLSEVQTRIVTGTGNTDIKQDLLLNNEDNPGLKIVAVLNLLSEYDSTYTEQLVPYLGPELLVLREHWLPLTNRVTMRPEQEILETIELLRTMAAHSVEEKEAFYYKKLADSAESTYTQYKVEEHRIVGETAEIMTSYRLNKTRLPRFAYRAGAAVCAAIAAVTFYYVSRDTGDKHLKAAARAISTDVISDVRTVDRMLDTETQPTVILNSANQLLEEERTRVDSLNFDPKRDRDISLRTSLNKLVGVAEKSIEDGEITYIELAELDAADKAVVNNSLADVDLLTRITLFGGIVLGYGAFGYFALRRASKNGGKLDQQLKIYRRGSLTKADWTTSDAVNSSFNFTPRHQRLV